MTPILDSQNLSKFFQRVLQSALATFLETRKLRIQRPRICIVLHALLCHQTMYWFKYKTSLTTDETRTICYVPPSDIVRGTHPPHTTTASNDVPYQDNYFHNEKCSLHQGSCSIATSMTSVKPNRQNQDCSLLTSTSNSSESQQTLTCPPDDRKMNSMTRSETPTLREGSCSYPSSTSETSELYRTTRSPRTSQADPPPNLNNAPCNRIACDNVDPRQHINPYTSPMYLTPCSNSLGRRTQDEPLLPSSSILYHPTHLCQQT